MKEMNQELQCDLWKMTELHEEELAKLPQKKIKGKIEDFNHKWDENLMVVLKNVIGMHNQIKVIETHDQSDMTLEVYFPALIKVYFPEFMTAKKIKLNAESSTSDMVNLIAFKFVDFLALR